MHTPHTLHLPFVLLQLRRVLDGEFRDRVGRVLILDCRYPFEFEGGHVRGAINAHDPLVVAEVRLPTLLS